MKNHSICIKLISNSKKNAKNISENLIAEIEDREEMNFLQKDVGEREEGWERNEYGGVRNEGSGILGWENCLKKDKQKDALD